jgi:maltose alpha-D-glucosyltransferase/alpha-amylase
MCLLAPDSLAVLAYVRQHPQETLLVLNNLSPDSQEVRLNLPNLGTPPIDLFTGEVLAHQPGAPLRLQLAGYEFRWFKLDEPEERGGFRDR